MAMIEGRLLDDASASWSLAKHRHFRLDDDTLTLKLFGKRGRTSKGSMSLLDISIDEKAKSDGAPPSAFDVVIDGKHLTIAADGLLAALKERLAKGTMTALAFDRHGMSADVMRLRTVPIPSTSAPRLFGHPCLLRHAMPLQVLPRFCPPRAH